LVRAHTKPDPLGVPGQTSAQSAQRGEAALAGPRHMPPWVGLGTCRLGWASAHARHGRRATGRGWTTCRRPTANAYRQLELRFSPFASRPLASRSLLLALCFSPFASRPLAGRGFSAGLADPRREMKSGAVGTEGTGGRRQASRLRRQVLPLRLQKQRAFFPTLSDEGRCETWVDVSHTPAHRHRELHEGSDARPTLFTHALFPPLAT
jgi:hypothetical protein